MKIDCTRYFKCHRCHRVVDRKREPMMQFSEGNQCIGLQPSFHSYCIDCWLAITKENANHLAGISGSEFANVISELMNQT